MFYFTCDRSFTPDEMGWLLNKIRVYVYVCADCWQHILCHFSAVNKIILYNADIDVALPYSAFFIFSYIMMRYEIRYRSVHD